MILHHPVRAVLAALVLIVVTSPVRAQGSAEFASSMRSHYRIQESGDTAVLHEIRLTNLTTLLFVSEFTMTIGGTGIKNIRALDDIGTLPVVRSSTHNTTTIVVNLESRPQLGIGKTKTLTISYSSSDVATAVGTVVEVNIPKMRDTVSLSSSQVTIEIPSKFGRPTRVTPDPSSAEESGAWTTLEFIDTKNEGISVLFGSSQTFLVDLSYDLNNPTDEPLVRSITLVPDTATQRVTVQELSPRPARVWSDIDGNWLAEYKLPPQNTLRVRANLAVETFLEPVIPVPASQPEAYLQALPFWEVDDERIRSLGRSLQTPSAMFQFVTSHLAYSYARINKAPERRGALGALANPTDAICTEFTDLFVAIARAAGIPVRELEGFAYSENADLRPLSLTKDILHAWPEYWDADRSRWVSVDPTWTNTTGGVDYFSKLDVNHIVFAIHGTSSTEPLPAGFFSAKHDAKKSVVVTPVTVPVIDIAQDVSIELFPTHLSSYRPTTLTLRVKNLGPRALYELPVVVDHRLRTIDAPPSVIPSLLPGEERDFTYSVRAAPWKQEETPLTVTIGESRETFTLTSSFRVDWTVALGILLALIGAISVGVALRARRLRLRR